MDRDIAARRAELAKEAPAKAAIVRLAYLTFVKATEDGYDTGEAIAMVVEAIRPLIKVEK